VYPCLVCLFHSQFSADRGCGSGGDGERPSGLACLRIPLQKKKSAAALQASPLIDSFDLTKDSDACAQLVRNTRELRGLLQDQGASGVL
jgi:hypothetical protein